MDIEDDLLTLDRKVKQLKLDYERYFLGTRPREPLQLRGEVQKLIAIYSNVSIQNTALRFRFSSLCSRYQAFKRQWSETLRKMEEGSYARHQFKAKIRGGATPVADPPDPATGDRALYDAYVEARRSCGQSVKDFSQAKLEAQLAKQRKTLAKRFGDAEVKFRVVVEDGKAKLKAKRVRS